MSDYAISRAAASAWPVLATALAGYGLHAVEHAARNIVTAGEPARAADLVIAILPPAAAPHLVLRSGGTPARIGFGYEDAGFAHALVAASIRADPLPAMAEPATLALFARAAKIAATRAPVVIAGESGTGKEGFARHIHARSNRSGEFVALNCAALPETMAEAMLFGHERGAFTGATAAHEGLFRAADHGTLFLDEVAELTPALQAKLLRALQEGAILPVGATRTTDVDVRIVAASNRDLAAEVAAGRLREDLYWRLAAVTLELRPLRERRQDIRAIAAAMLIDLAREGLPFAWPTSAALDALLAHDWPGNARQLRHVLFNALLANDGDRIEAADLDLPVAVHASRAFVQTGRASQADLIRRTLAANDGHRARTAADLGVSERTLRYRLADMRIAA